MKGSYGERLAIALRLKNLHRTNLALKIGINRIAISKIIHKPQYLNFGMVIKTYGLVGIFTNWSSYGRESGLNPKFCLNPDHNKIVNRLKIPSMNKNPSKRRVKNGESYLESCNHWEF